MVIYANFTRSIDEAARISATNTDLLARIRQQWLGGESSQACATSVRHGRLRTVHSIGLQMPLLEEDIRTFLQVSTNANKSRLKAPLHLQRDTYR